MHVCVCVCVYVHRLSGDGQVYVLRVRGCMSVSECAGKVCVVNSMCAGVCLGVCTDYESALYVCTGVYPGT